MKMRNTAAGIARRAAAHRAVLDALVAKMHANYMRPMSLHRVGVKYARTHSCIRELFECRGLFVRPFKQIDRQPNGSPVRHVPFTPVQLAAMVARATAIKVPAELKFEWRTWSLERRGKFIARLRAKLNRAGDRPKKLRAIWLEFKGAKIAKLELGTEGADHFRAAQKDRVAKIAAIFALSKTEKAAGA